jgi:hypothetical protein
MRNTALAKELLELAAQPFTSAEKPPQWLKLRRLSRSLAKCDLDGQDHDAGSWLIFD